MFTSKVIGMELNFCSRSASIFNNYLEIKVKYLTTNTKSKSKTRNMFLLNSLIVCDCGLKSFYFLYTHQIKLNSNSYYCVILCFAWPHCMATFGFTGFLSFPKNIHVGALAIRIEKAWILLDPDQNLLKMNEWILVIYLHYLLTFFLNIYFMFYQQPNSSWSAFQLTLFPTSVVSKKQIPLKINL